MALTRCAQARRGERSGAHVGVTLPAAVLVLTHGTEVASEKKKLVKLHVPSRARGENFVSAVTHTAICYSFLFHMFSDNCR